MTTDVVNTIVALHERNVNNLSVNGLQRIGPDASYEQFSVWCKNMARLKANLNRVLLEKRINLICFLSSPLATCRWSSVIFATDTVGSSPLQTTHFCYEMFVMSKPLPVASHRLNSTNARAKLFAVLQSMLQSHPTLAHGSKRQRLSLDSEYLYPFQDPQ